MVKHQVQNNINIYSSSMYSEQDLGRRGDVLDTEETPRLPEECQARLAHWVQEFPTSG
jgi:hypothetical protein